MARPPRKPAAILGYDPAVALEHLRTADPKLGALIDRVEAAGHPFKIQPAAHETPFHALLRAILYQQLHGKAAATIHHRLRLIYALPGAEPLDPHPQALLDTPEELLRAAGVSGNKIKAMRDLAARVLDGTVPTHRAILKLTDEEIVERLTQVRGVGSWTVEMLLIFRLGRPDVFPVTDYGVRKGFALTFGRLPKSRAITAADLPKPEVMLKRAKRWAPYRSVAAWYLWRACDLDAASRKAPSTLPPK